MAEKWDKLVRPKLGEYVLRAVDALQYDDNVPLPDMVFWSYGEPFRVTVKREHEDDVQDDTLEFLDRGTE